jgi:large conductance mechanosensitive channel
MLKGFKEFVLRGNVVDLAVGIVIGVAFGTVVSSFVKNLLTPLVAIPGKTDFASLSFEVRDSTFAYGQFLNDAIAFVLVAAAVYYAVVVPMNRLAERRARGVAPDKKACPACLGDIPVAAGKCMFCGTEQAPAPA